MQQRQDGLQKKIIAEPAELIWIIYDYMISYISIYTESI